MLLVIAPQLIQYTVNVNIEVDVIAIVMFAGYLTVKKIKRRREQEKDKEMKEMSEVTVNNVRYRTKKDEELHIKFV